MKLVRLPMRLRPWPPLILLAACSGGDIGDPALQGPPPPAARHDGGEPALDAGSDPADAAHRDAEAPGDGGQDDAGPLGQNQPPTVDAGSSSTVVLPELGRLSGSAGDDGRPAGALQLEWTLVGGPATVAIDDPRAASTSVRFDVAGTYTFRLTASDGELTTSDTVEVLVTATPPSNRAPVVNAGTSQTVDLPGSALLSGTAADDGLPNGTLAIAWSSVSGPAPVSFTDSTAVQTSAHFTAAGRYVLRLTADDGELVATSDVQILVRPENQAPTAAAGPDQTITLPAFAVLAGAASDDGLPGPLTVQWYRASGPGAVTFANPASLNTTATFTVAGAYVLRLDVSDGVLMASDTVAITVNPRPPVNQAPTVSAGPDRAIVLPATANLAGTAADDGLPSGTLTLTWSRLNGPGTVTFTNPAAAQTSASFSAPGNYTLELRATDGALMAADTMQVAVGAAPQRQILMYVAYNDVWWAEYKVLYQALLAAGFAVDVRSSSPGNATSNYSTAVDQTQSAQPLDPNFPAPATYAAFQTLYQADFGQAWNVAWNPTANIPLNGRIQDVASMAPYEALVIPGGRGMVAYRYDGSYADQASVTNPGAHISPAADVQAAALRLNSLIGEALAAGKPVAAECHGAPTVAFARVPNSTGGYLNLGRSVLAGRAATGYAFSDSDTVARYQDLGVVLLPREKVVIDGPDAPDFSGNGRDLIITSADWYPETVAHVARTLLNVLESQPTPAARTRPINVLVYGGDEPVNYPPEQPARYTDLVALLNDAGDDLQLNAVGTSNAADLTAANLAGYEVLLFFGHDAIGNANQVAVRDWVDGGGGLVAVHHAIYNQANNKGTLVNLIGAELPANVQLNSQVGIFYNGAGNHLLNVNLGHFVSTHGVYTLGPAWQSAHYDSPRGMPNANTDNDAARGYYAFTIPANDELYLGTAYLAGINFGRGVNQVNRLFSHDHSTPGSPNPNNGAYDNAGWVRLYDGNTDGVVGRVVYLQPGETVARTLASPAYRQVLKNAVVWAAN